MAKAEFNFELVSPEKLVASEPATMVVVPGEAGVFGVLAEHSPMLSSLQPGVVEIHNDDGDSAPQKIFVAGGFADVGENQCTILAEEAVAVSDLDAGALEQTVADLKEDLDRAGDDAVKAGQVQRALDIATAKLSATQDV